MNIENREEIVEQLTDMLMDFEKHPNSAYVTDVYAYYDEKTQTVELRTFVNPGGNSWISDDHITIYKDPQHCDSSLDLFVDELGGRSESDDISDLVEAAVGNEKDECSKLMSIIAKENEIDVEDIDLQDVIYFISKHRYHEDYGKYYDNVQEAWNDYIDEHYTDYAGEAKRLVSEYESEYSKTHPEYEQTSSNERPAAPAVTEKQSWIKQTLASAKDKADEINRTHETKKQNIDKSL